MEFSLDQLRELIQILDQTDVAELTLESGDLRLTLRKSESKVIQAVAGDLPLAVAPEVVNSTTVTEPTTSTATQTPEPKPAEDLIDIVSPMVGTFYRASAPGEDPFIEVGDNVTKGQAVCIIEAMKLMNEIEAEVGGRIAEILIENAQPVEYGQTLMRVAPVGKGGKK